MQQAILFIVLLSLLLSTFADRKFFSGKGEEEISGGQGKLQEQMQGKMQGPGQKIQEEIEAEEAQAEDVQAQEEEVLAEEAQVEDVQVQEENVEVEAEEAQVEDVQVQEENIEAEEARVEDVQVQEEEVLAEETKVQEKEGEQFDLECETSIVGAGMGGVYTAWRLVTAEDSGVDATKICLFERRETHGGLMLPVEISTGKKIEMGIEYFDTSMPFVGELVEYLGIPSECAYIYGHHEKNEETLSPEEEVAPEGAEMEEENVQQYERKGQQKTRDAKQGEMINEPQAAVAETCEKISTAFWFFRNKLVTKDTLIEDVRTLYNLKKLFEKVPDLVDISFKSVFGDRIKLAELLEMAKEEDTLVRWGNFATIIDSIIFHEDVTHNGVALNELSMDTILKESIEDREWLRAAVDFAHIPSMKALLALNFEQFAVEYMRHLANGRGEVRKITSPEGMKTIIDVMVEELKNRGVQIFYSSTLSDFSIRDDNKFILEILEGERKVLTDRLVLAISAENLKHLKYSQGLSELSGETSEALGNLKKFEVFSGVLFYERAWWKELGLSGFSTTDSRFDILHYINDKDCEETKRCALRFYTLLDSTDRLNTIDLVNMLHTSSPITHITSDKLTWTPRDSAVMSRLHKIVSNIHKDYPGFSDLEISEPVSALFSNFATDEVMNMGSFGIPSRLRLSDFLQAMLYPAPGFNLHLINSDYSEIYHNPVPSVVSAERVLHNLLGLAKPAWIKNEIQYNHYTRVE